MKAAADGTAGAIAAARERIDSWVSVHCYHAGSPYDAHSQEAITEHVVKLVDDLQAAGFITQYFFVRYSDPRAHVRLRLAGRHHEIATYLGSWIEEHRIRNAEPDRGRGTGRPGSPIEPVFARYDPEYARYGGPAILPIVEQFFVASSEVALAYLRARNTHSRASDAGHAALAAAMLVLSLSLRPQTEGMVLRSKAAGVEVEAAKLRELTLLNEPVVERISEALRAIVEPGHRLPREWRRYARACRSLRLSIERAIVREPQVFHGKPLPHLEDVWRQLLPSLLHMGNNRFGIAPTLERGVLWLAAEGIQRLRAGSP